MVANKTIDQLKLILEALKWGRREKK